MKLKIQGVLAERTSKLQRGFNLRGDKQIDIHLKALKLLSWETYKSKFMNVFSGSRRIAAVAGALWVIGWLIAAATHETTVVARYESIGGSKNVNFVGFDIYSSCPQNTKEHSFKLKTEAGRLVEITLCIFLLGINLPPEGFVLDDPKLLLENPFFKYADIETKRNLFDRYVGQHPGYISANPATQKTIRDRFGISEIDNKSVDPNAYLAEKRAEALSNARRRLAEQEAKAEGNAPPLEPNEIEFKISKQEEERLNKKWWESWRTTFGQGLAAMFGGLAALWVLSIAMGWIVRGFLGIPDGMDSKP
jgi:hypothetical protein